MIYPQVPSRSGGRTVQPVSGFEVRPVQQMDQVAVARYVPVWRGSRALISVGPRHREMKAHKADQAPSVPEVRPAGRPGSSG